MRRWLFNILAGASLLLCLATATMWVRSYWVSDAYWSGVDKRGLVNGETGWIIGSYLGAFSVGYSRPVDVPPLRHIRSLLDTELSGWRAALRNLWFAWKLRSHGWYISYPDRSPLETTVYIPYWVPALLTVILPWRWLAIWRRHRRSRRLGLCRKCGYDLRASPVRCPECGTPVPEGHKPALVARM